jgi:hydroxypyruvate isomerase
MALNLSACIEMIFSALPFEDRIKAVADTGLKAFEFWGFSNKNMDTVVGAAAQNGMTISSIASEVPPLVDPANHKEFVEGAQRSIGVALKYGINTVIVCTGNEMAELSRWAQHDAIVNGLRGIAPYAEDTGITLVLEALNILVDHKGYYLARSDEGFDIVRAVGSPNVKLLYDIYHQQITEGFLIPTITANLPLIGHFHCADVPGRHEPGSGEINYANVFKVIADSDYTGYVGLEYSPTGDPAASLAQVRKIAGQA